MDRDALVKILQSESNLKYSFSGNEIESLCHWMTIETSKQAETLINKGDPADSLLFILSGLVKTLCDDRQVGLHAKGDFAGESFFQTEALTTSMCRQ